VIWRTYNNLLEKGWTKKQPFRKRLGQKLQPMGKKVQAKQVGPKNNLLRKGLSEAGWAKNYNRWGKRFKRSRLGQKLNMIQCKFIKRTFYKFLVQPFSKRLLKGWVGWVGLVVLDCYC
jgi:hypothetical protein